MREGFAVHPQVGHSQEVTGIHSDVFSPLILVFSPLLPAKIILQCESDA